MSQCSKKKKNLNYENKQEMRPLLCYQSYPRGTGIYNLKLKENIFSVEQVLICPLPLISCVHC